MRIVNIKGYLSGLLLLAMVPAVNAASIVMHPRATSQLGGINEVEINGVLWDATFYNAWSVTPDKETYSGQFSEDASKALFDLFNSSFAPLKPFAANPSFIWGIESTGTGGGRLFTPYLASFVDSFPDYWMKTGYAYFVNGSVDRISNHTGDYDNITTFVQWSLSDTAVPIPAAVWLFGSGLIGLIGVARRKKS